MAYFDRALLASFFALSLLLACGDDGGTPDTGTTDTGTTDTGGGGDTGADTGTPTDSGTDTATEDTGAGDASTGDTGTGDTGTGDAAGRTPCGDGSCDPATEVCFECACGGPTSFACMAVPSGCTADRSCTCIGPALCTTGLMACTDRGDNHVFCDTGLD